MKLVLEDFSLIRAIVLIFLLATVYIVPNYKTFDYKQKSQEIFQQRNDC